MSFFSKDKMPKRIDSREFRDPESYRAALKKQYSKTEEESAADYERHVEKVSVPTRYGMVVRNSSIAILVVLLLFFLFFFGKNLYDDYQSRENVEKLQVMKASLPDEEKLVEIPVLKKETEEEDSSDQPKEHVVMMLSEYAPLYRENPDLCGWLRIPDTEIDYPVMHRDDDNDFYLSHNFYGGEDVNGLLVLDKRCPEDGSGNHLLIHGHNMKSGFMFGGLKKYKDEEYGRSHPLIYYDTLTEPRVYQIFSVFQSSTNLADQEDFHYYDYIDLETQEDFDAYVSAARQQSLYEMDTDVQYGDRLITLSTCDYSKDNGRLVIVGKEVSD